MRLSTYEKAVKKARGLVREREKMKWKIAKLAYDTCEVVIGGHHNKTKEIYSLTKFADDIGVNRKTLSDWVHNYEIRLHLHDLGKISGTTTHLSDETVINETRKKLRAMDGGLIKNKTPKTIAKTFELVMEESHEERQLKSLIKQATTLEFKIVHELDLTQIDQTKLARTLKLCESIKSKLDLHFDIYKKPRVILRKQNAKHRAKTNERRRQVATH